MNVFSYNSRPVTPPPNSMEVDSFVSPFTEALGKGAPPGSDFSPGTAETIRSLIPEIVANDSPRKKRERERVISSVVTNAPPSPYDPSKKPKGPCERVNDAFFRSPPGKKSIVDLYAEERKQAGDPISHGSPLFPGTRVVDTEHLKKLTYKGGYHWIPSSEESEYPIDNEVVSPRGIRAGCVGDKGKVSSFFKASNIEEVFHQVHEAQPIPGASSDERLLCKSSSGGLLEMVADSKKKHHLLTVYPVLIDVDLTNNCVEEKIPLYTKTSSGELVAKTPSEMLEAVVAVIHSHQDKVSRWEEEREQAELDRSRLQNLKKVAQYEDRQAQGNIKKAAVASYVPNMKSSLSEFIQEQINAPTDSNVQYWINARVETSRKLKEIVDEDRENNAEILRLSKERDCLKKNNPVRYELLNGDLIVDISETLEKGSLKGVYVQVTADQLRTGSIYSQVK